MNRGSEYVNDFEKKVAKAQDGDKESLIELIMQRQNQFYRIAYSYLGNEQKVFDALQETIIKSFHSITKLREKSYFYTWYISILRNTCKKMIISDSNIVYVSDFIENNIDCGNFNEEKMDLFNGIMQLKEKFREIIYLRYIEDLTIKEISEILNCPEGTVKSRIYYGVLKLKEYVQIKEGDKYELQ